MGLYVPFLVVGMLVTGSSNSLWAKYQDMQCVENCSDQDPSKRVYYEQPVWQTLQMFVGELGCFIPVLISLLRNRHRKRSSVAQDAQPLAIPKPGQRASLGWKGCLLFWLPALCDLTATTLMNVGLIYTPVSIYQMTRGSLVLFVGILSVFFLRRHLYFYQWFALITVVSGVAIVGLSGSIVKNALKQQPPKLISLEESPNEVAIIVGILFVLFAQIGTAVQFVLEEKIMTTYAVSPLVAVGLEGFFGLFTILLVSPILVHFKSKSPFFDLSRGWHQMMDNPTVLWSAVATGVSIGFYNFFGMSVTRHISATMRSIIDTCRTISIWIVSLGLGWEHFLVPYSFLQVAGFTLLVYGTFLFNSLIPPPRCIEPSTITEYEASAGDEERRGLLDDETIIVIDEREAVASRALDQTAALPADLGQSGFDVVPPPVPHVGPARRD